MKANELVDKIAEEDSRIAAVERQLKKLKATRESLQAKLLSKLAKMKVDSLKIGKLTAAVRESSFISIDSDKKFFAYVRKHDAYDLLQRRVSPVAVREREEHGEKVPGLKTFTKKWIQLRKGR